MSGALTHSLKLPLPKEAYEDLAALAAGEQELTYLLKNTHVLWDASDLDAAVLKLSSNSESQGLRLERVSQALMSLSALRRNLGYTPQDLLSTISAAIDEFATAEWKTAYAENWNKVHGLLEQILDPNGSISTLEKARILAYSYSNPLTNAQLITDIRPVFDAAANEIKRVSVSFVLAIEHHEGGRHRRTDFALDYADVENLLRQCIRARKKAQTIAEQFSKCEWTTSVAGMSKESETQ